MAVAPLPSTVEIMDLRLLGAAALSDLLRAEERDWAGELRWDFRPAADLLRRNIETGHLPGYAALAGGRALGYCFFLYEGNKGLLGGLYTLPGTGEQAGEIPHRLATHALETLMNTPQVSRVEAQLIHFHGKPLRPLFEKNSFEVFPRLFLYRSLTDAVEPRATAATGAAGKADWAIASWKNDFEPLAGLITEAYENHVDSRLNDQYATRAGAQRFLQNIVTFPGCGVFLQECSLRAVDPRTGEWLGVVMVSEVSDKVAHVTQICVRRDQQGQGLGRVLLEESLRRLHRAGFEGVSLTVTALNRRAVQLYRDLGFETLKEFDAYARDLP